MRRVVFGRAVNRFGFMQRTLFFLSIWGLTLLLAALPGRSQAQSGRVPIKSPAPKVSYSGRLCVPDKDCGADSLQFVDSTANTVISEWKFGDGRKTVGKSVSHLYTRAGAFTVTLKRSGPGVSLADSVTFSVTVGNNPQPFNKWRTDTTICHGQTISLDPYGSANATYKYLWYPKGDTTQVLKVDSSGCYSVESIDRTTGCSYQNKINVKVCGEKSGQQGAKWYFGSNAGLDFSGGSPTPITDSKVNTLEGVSSIADTKGKLQFYTDGITVYDRNGAIMKSVIPGDTAYRPLGGSHTSTQSALIVPKPTCRGCEYLYYVYTTSEVRGTKALTYSVVDMRENKGKGAIVARNIPYIGKSTERSASVRNDKDTTYWVITHDYGGNTYRVGHLTKGATTTQTFDFGMKQDTVTKAEGYLQVGPADTTSATKGNRTLAMVVPGPTENYVELTSFNDQTGKITGPVRRIDLGPYPPKAYGVTFSPDGKGVYVSLNDTTSRGASYIVRYDVSQQDSLALANSRILVDSSTTRQYGALQLASDGRIYVAVKGANTLAVIGRPNAGLIGDFQFSPTGQSLGGKTSQLGLPNLVANFNSSSGGPALMKGDSCAGRPTQFQISPACPPLKEFYTLDFGDKSKPYSGTATQTTHTYNIPGTYAISLRVQVQRTDGAGVCLDTLLKQTITIIATPDKIDLGSDIGPVCINGVTLNANVTASQYVWVRNGQVVGRSRTLFATRSGTYIVFAANISCYQTDTIQVTLLRPPVLDLGPDSTYCTGTPFVLTVPQQTWNGFTWSNGQTTKSITITKPGLYSLTATNAQGCTNTDSIRLKEAPRPRVSAVLSGPTTCTGTDGRIQLTPTPSGTYSYSWTIGNTTLPTKTATLSNLRVGIYNVRATNQLGCAVDTSFILNSPANPLRVSVTPYPALCSKPASGSAQPVVQGGTGSFYTWFDKNNNLVSTAPTLTSAVSGTYSVAVSDVNGCTAIASNIVIGLDSTGFANLGPDRLKCVNDTVVLTPLDGGLVAENAYLWSTGSKTRTISVSVSGLYSVRVKNSKTGCVGHDTVRVAFNPKPIVSVGPAVGFCQSTSAVQLIGATPAGGKWSGQGIDSTGRFVPLPSLVGSTITAIYSVTVQGCDNSAARAVTIKPLPTVSAGPDVSLCAGITARVRATGSAGTTFQWSTGITGATLQVPQTGNYIVIGTLDGCQARDTVKVTILPTPVIGLPNRIGICFPDGLTGTLRVAGDTTLAFLWLPPNLTTRQIVVNKAGTYTVKATALNGCTTTDSTIVVEECEPRLFVPTTFTPNGDRVNDQLEIFSAYVIDYELRIYNRWGEAVFVTNSPEQKWDGTFKGEVYPTMLYPYIVIYRSSYFPDRPPITKRGSILLTK